MRKSKYKFIFTVFGARKYNQTTTFTCFIYVTNQLIYISQSFKNSSHMFLLHVRERNRKNEISHYETVISQIVVMNKNE